MIHTLRLALVPAFLLLCLILGGASAAGYWANMGLQLIAVAIILWATLAHRNTPMAPAGRRLIGLLLLMVSLIVAQLVPLPPSVWTPLPGREAVVEGFALLGQPLPWMPISLAPGRTVASALWLLPAIAVLLGILRLGGYKAGWLAWTLAGATIVAVIIGALQRAGGDQSPLYFYQITNFGSATGFFSNANHMATLLVVAVPFLAALYLNAQGKGRSVQRSSGLFFILAGAMAVVCVGLAVNGSLAGVGLAVPVLAASAMMILSKARRVPLWAIGLIALLTAGSVAAVFSTPFGNNLTNDTAKISQESRYVSFSRSMDAAGDFMPAGSGIGTFKEIYQSREDPAAVTKTYMNHVHSDLIELALETGAAGLLLILLFLFWWGGRVIAIWRAGEADHYARAATIASAAILAHSLVDYPLRTAAIGALLAMCCALMADPRPRARRGKAASPEKQARHLSAD